MATYDSTSSSTTGVEANSIAVMPSAKNTNVMRNIEAYLDIDALVAAGGSYSAGDVFQVLEIPANTLCLLYTSPSPRDLSTSRMPSSA